jgi:hypothetical protein
MYDFWKARRARRAAAAAIIPFMGQTRQRLGEIPDSTWSNAYVIGFVSTLITLVAERDAGALGSSALASVQTGAWSDITQTDSVLLGDEICFFSVAGDRTFELGCHNAASFFDALDVVNSNQEESLFEESAASAAFGHVGAESGSGLWMRYFDAYLGRVPTARI